MDALTRIMDDEGFSAFAYRCPAGKLTIGFGRNIDGAGGKGITRSEAIHLLINDIRECEYDLRQIFSPTFWDTLDHVRRNALVNMRFQLGPHGFRGFVNMIDAIRDRDFRRARNEALDSEWARQTPRRAQRVADEIDSGVDLE